MSDRALGETLDLVAGVVVGRARAQVVERLLVGGDLAASLRRLRRALSTHRLRTDGGVVELAGLVSTLDRATVEEGFHVLHSWDHAGHRFTDDPTPVLMLDFLGRTAGDGVDARRALALLIDYYLLHVLALCAMRAWDGDGPDEALGRVTDLLGALQGEGGSGHRFVRDAEALLIYALSQFHPEEQAYGRFLERVAVLETPRRVRFASVSAPVLGAHLRWGFWLMYGRDVFRMRSDNVGDYPWLLWSVRELLEAYEAATAGPADDAERLGIVDALVQGLAADPWAFTARVPAALADLADTHGRARALLEKHGDALLADAEACRPSKASYSPLALHFNFPHNALVALVALALLRGEPQRVPLDALLARASYGDGPTADDDPLGSPARERVALDLTAFSGSSPDRLGSRGARLVAYDPHSGLRSFTMAVKAIGDSLSV